MKNILKASVVAVALLVGIFAYSTQTTVAKYVPAVPAAESNASPRSLYVAHCSSCHGRNGRADTPKGRETDADDLTTGKVQGMSVSKMSGIIKRGKGDMPAFGKKLSAAQIKQIISHVKTL